MAGKDKNTAMYVSIGCSIFLILGMTIALAIIGVQYAKYERGEIISDNPLKEGTKPKVANSKTTVCPLEPAGAKCTVITCKKGMACDLPVEQFGNIGQNSNRCPKCMRFRKHKTIRYKQHKFLLK